MSIKPPFFSTIHDSTPSCPHTRLKFLHFGETLFDFGQKSYKIYPVVLKPGYIGIIEVQPRQISQIERIFKIFLLCTLIAPAVGLLARVTYRTLNNFNVIPLSVVFEKALLDGFFKTF